MGPLLPSVRDTPTVGFPFGRAGGTNMQQEYPEMRLFLRKHPAEIVIAHARATKNVLPLLVNLTCDPCSLRPARPVW
jgi:hypothetical protein